MECKKLKAKIWYELNKQKYRDWHKQWKDSNPGRKNELQADYLKRNRQAVAARKRKHRKENPSVLLEERKRRLARIAKNPEAYLEYRRNGKSKEKYGEYWEAHRVSLLLTRQLNKRKKSI